MADIKWIKIVTDIFDDEKFSIIDAMPEADAIELIWFKLLVFAGKSNNNGIFFFNDRIAYTDEMLANVFHRPLNTVRLALQTFINLGMIEEIDGVYTIPSWEKHQSLDAYEKKKERDRIASQKYREKQKLLLEEKKTSDESSDESSDVSRFCSYSYSNSYSFNNNKNINNLIYILENKEYENEYTKYINSNPVLKDVVCNWMKYKDERKPKSQNHYEETSINSLIKKICTMCSQYGDVIIEGIIEDSISNHYQGIVWDKLKASKPSYAYQSRNNSDNAFDFLKKG